MQGVANLKNSGARVGHPDDPNGYYFHRPHANEWQWVATNRKEDVK